MGADPLKGVVHPHIGQGAEGPDPVELVGVPGQGHVHLIKYAVLGQEGLGGAALLGGTAEIDHRARAAALLQILLHRHGGGQAPRAQKVVSAAVAVSPLCQGLRPGDPRLLAQPRQGVKFPQDPDHGGAAAIGAGEGGGDPVQPGADGEALLFQGPHQNGGGLFLGVVGLRVVPDGIPDGVEELRLPVQQVQCGLFAHKLAPL